MATCQSRRNFQSSSAMFLRSCSGTRGEMWFLGIFRFCVCWNRR